MPRLQLLIWLVGSLESPSPYFLFNIIHHVLLRQNEGNGMEGKYIPRGVTMVPSF